MQIKRDKKRKVQMILEGRCPECEVILEFAPNHDCNDKKWKIVD